MKKKNQSKRLYKYREIKRGLKKNDLNKLQTHNSQEPKTNMWYLENKDETLFIDTMKKNNTNIFL